MLDDFDRLIKPYATGNLHPAFMGWVHGAGTPVGMIADMLASGLNANCGGRNHIAIDVERQIALWMGRVFGFPDTASGLFVTGSSMANFLAVLVARTHGLGRDIRATGIAGLTVPLCLRLGRCARLRRASHGHGGDGIGQSQAGSVQSCG